MNLTTLISVVIPAHNESQGIKETIKQVSETLNTCEGTWEIIVVDDGSRDQTYEQLCALSEADPRIKGIALSRNFGKEAALLAGLEYATGKAVITLDADLQHPPNLIPEMIDKWRSGAQIVHAVKRSREDESKGKKTATYCMNQMISRLGRININNSSDYKLLDREIVEIIVHKLQERVRFFRGMTSWLGFSEAYIYYDVASRHLDKSKFGFLSLLELSITALTSFTSMPLRVVTLLGLATLLLGFVVVSDTIWSVVNGHAVSGYATIIISLLLIGSFIMISLGIIGEYIAKVYEEVKARPHYLIRASVGVTNKNLGGRT